MFSAPPSATPNSKIHPRKPFRSGVNTQHPCWQGLPWSYPNTSSFELVGVIPKVPSSGLDLPQAYEALEERHQIYDDLEGELVAGSLGE